MTVAQNVTAREAQRAPSVLQLVGIAYRDATDALVRVPHLFLMVVAADLAIHNLNWLIFKEVGYSDLVLMGAVNFATVVLKVLATMPLVVVIQRIILVDDASVSSALAKNFGGLLRYFAISVALYSANNLGFIFCLFGDSSSGRGLITTWIASANIFSIWLCVLALFPALAVKFPRAGFSGAIDGLTGRIWRTILVLIMALLPIVILKPIAYQIDMRFIREFVARYRSPFDPYMSSYELWFLITELCFIMIWALVAVVGAQVYAESRASALADNGTGQPPATPNPRERQF